MSVLRRAGSFCRPGNLRLLAGKAAHGFDYFNIDYRLPGGFSLPPKSVCLILSEKCNLRCRMCDIGGRGGSGASGMVRSIGSGAAAMGIRDWLAVLDDLAAFTPRPLVLLTGTEPLVSPHAEAVIAGVAERGLPLHITTNGALLERHARFIAEQCRRSVAADIAVSLDGPPAVHDDIRGVPGTYAAAVRGMQAVAAAREKLGSRFPRLSITAQEEHQFGEGGLRG